MSTVHVCVRGHWQYWPNANGYIETLTGSGLLSHQCHAVQWVTDMTLPYFSTSPASPRARFTKRKIGRRSVKKGNCKHDANGYTIGAIAVGIKDPFVV